MWDPSSSINPTILGFISHFLTTHITGGQTFDRPSSALLVKQGLGLLIIKGNSRDIFTTPPSLCAISYPRVFCISFRYREYGFAFLSWIYFRGRLQLRGEDQDTTVTVIRRPIIRTRLVGIAIATTITAAASSGRFSGFFKRRYNVFTRLEHPTDPRFNSYFPLPRFVTTRGVSWA
jgi:hypothetical protein